MTAHLHSLARRRVVRWLLLLAFLTAVACAGPPPVDPTEEPTEEPGPESQVTPVEGVAIIATDTAVLRAAPDAASAEVATLNRDDVVVLLARTADGDWRQVIHAGSNVRGWVDIRLLAFVTPTPTDEATEVPEEEDTPTPTLEPEEPPTATASDTPAPPEPTDTSTVVAATRTLPAPTNTNTPRPPDPTNTSTIAVTPPPAATTPSGGAGPLEFDFSVSWRLDPSDPTNHAIATVVINARGGGGGYTYYHDDILQPGRTFEYRWRVCRGNPTSFRVDSAGGQSARKDWFGQPPCPDPPTPENTPTINPSLVPVPYETSTPQP